MAAKRKSYQPNRQRSGGRNRQRSVQLSIPQAVAMLVIFLAVQLVTTLVVAFAAGQGWLPEAEMTNIASGLAALINIVWVILRTRSRGIDLWDRSRAVAYVYDAKGRGISRESRASRLIPAAAAVILLAVTANICLNGVIEMSGIKHFDPLFDSVAQTFAGGSYTMQMITFGVLVPVAEEIIFRGIVYRAIRQRLGGTTVPILITSLIFAVYHGNLTQGIYALFVGVLLCVVCEAGGLVAAILLHIGINLVSLVGNTLPSYIEIISHAADHWPVIAAAAVLTVALTLLILRLLLYERPSRI